MSPILVRPVREQLEHDRIIRLLPGKYKRKFEVGINPGAEQNAGVGAGVKATYPDAVLYSTERKRRVEGVVEVETVESINHLEAMSQWATYGRLKVPFHLYVPVGALDVARRLASDHEVVVTEIWSYDNIGDQVRFTLVHKAPDPPRPTAAARPIATPRPAVALRRARSPPPPGHRRSQRLRLRARLRPPRPRCSGHQETRSRGRSSTGGPGTSGSKSRGKARQTGAEPEGGGSQGSCREAPLSSPRSATSEIHARPSRIRETRFWCTRPDGGAKSVLLSCTGSGRRRM